MTINLRDYSRTAAQRGWGAGWPSCTGAKGRTVVVTAKLSGTRVSVHRDVARLVSMLLDETERRGYRFKPGQTGAYNCRPIGGTQRPSNHSWALAVDGNWNDNPMRKPLRTDMPGWLVQLWNRFGFAWGGHYSGTPDPMHFEFMGTPADAAAMTALALRELAGVTMPATQPAKTATVPGTVLRRGMKGPEIGRWQDFVNRAYSRFAPPLRVDDDFGDATERRTRELQTFLGLGVDGVVGPEVRGATGFR